MTLRAFFLTTDTRAALADLAAFANAPENFYRVFKVDWIPGHRPEFVRMIDTFRVVFTITVLPDQSHWRHLTVSIVGMSEDSYPNHFVVFTIATLLGFTGGKVTDGDVTIAPGPWELAANPVERCALVVQRMDPS